MKFFLTALAQALWAEIKRFAGLVGVGIPLGLGITLGGAMSLGTAELILNLVK